MTTEAPTGEAGIQAHLLDFVRRELVPGDVDIDLDDDLLTGELLDSMAILRLATHVDDTFRLGMKPADFRVENFQTLRALGAYVLAAKA